LLVTHLHPELTRGGSQQAHYELFQGLRAEADVEAYFLGATDPTTPGLYKAGASITGFDGRSNEFIYLATAYDYLWHRTPPRRHVEAFVELLETIRPDVVHFRHFTYFGMGLLTLARRILPDCRIVFTFCDFFTICEANGHMLRRTDGSVCAGASPVRCHQCFPDRPPEHFMLRRLWFQRHLSVVDRFACPSRFQIEHFVDWGIAREKIFHVPTGQLMYARSAPPDHDGCKNRFGFFGRFIDGKGVHIVLRAVQELRSQGFFDFIVELNADGLETATLPIRREIEAFLAEEAARPPAERNVLNNGPYQADQIETRMQRVDWCIVPSIWREVFGLVISEAWMFGRPVIGSNIGSMAERIEHEVDGLLFEAGDPRALAAAMRRAATEPGLWGRLSAATPEPPSLAGTVTGYRALYQ